MFVNIFFFAYYLIQICVHGGIDIDPDKPTATADSSKMKSLQQFVGTHFPGLENTPSIIDTCIYTVRLGL